MTVGAPMHPPPCSHRWSIAAALLTAAVVTGSAALAQSTSPGSRTEAATDIPPVVMPLIDEARRAARQQAEAAARRAAAEYVASLRDGSFDVAEEWMPTETRREAVRDAERRRLMWEALQIESFEVVSAAVAGTRQATADVAWRARFDAEGYVERMMTWQRDRFAAMGIDPSEFDARAATVRAIVRRAAEHLTEVAAAPTVRLRLRPADPDATTFPRSHEAWRIEDAFLPTQH